VFDHTQLIGAAVNVDVGSGVADEHPRLTNQLSATTTVDAYLLLHNTNYSVVPKKSTNQTHAVNG